MAALATILSDDSKLSRMDRAYFKLEKALTLVGGSVILALVFLAVTNVLGRWIFSLPVDGYIDWVEQAMAFMAFLGIAYTQREGGHIRMDIVVGLLKGRALWLFELITVTAILILMLALVWGAWAHFDRSFDCARPWCSRDSSIDVSLPIWPSKLLVPIAFAVLCARLVLQAVGYGRAFVLGLANPVAVPLIQSVADQAKAEAEALEGAD